MAFAGEPAGSTPSDLVFFHFVGPTAIVTTTDGQSLTGVASAAISFAPANPGQTIATLAYTLCFQDANTNGLISGFGFSNSGFIFPVDKTLSASAAASRVFTAGTWRVGFCASSDADIGGITTVTGWVQVTH